MSEVCLAKIFSETSFCFCLETVVDQMVLVPVNYPAKYIALPLLPVSRWSLKLRNALYATATPLTKSTASSLELSKGACRSRGVGRGYNFNKFLGVSEAAIQTALFSAWIFTFSSRLKYRHLIGTMSVFNCLYFDHYFSNGAEICQY